MERFNRSASRVSLPVNVPLLNNTHVQNFDGSELLKLISLLLEIDDRYIPQGRGYALYIRPVLIGTRSSLAMEPADSALLYVIASPVGPYYREGLKAIRLMAKQDAVRAWPGGAGFAKISANYGPCILPLLEATQSGYNQNLWYRPPSYYLF
jgi:branched-chain amino acid aminotransferase